jgi:hypothetical protein
MITMTEMMVMTITVDDSDDVDGDRDSCYLGSRVKGG